MSFFDVINNIESPLKNGSKKEQIESNQGVQDQKSTNSKIKLTIYMILDSTWNGHSESTTTTTNILPRISTVARTRKLNRHRRQYRRFLRRCSWYISTHIHHCFFTFLHFHSLFSFTSIHRKLFFLWTQKKKTKQAFC